MKAIANSMAIELNSKLEKANVRLNDIGHDDYSVYFQMEIQWVVQIFVDSHGACDIVVDRPGIAPARPFNCQFEPERAIREVVKFCVSLQDIWDRNNHNA